MLALIADANIAEPPGAGSCARDPPNKRINEAVLQRYALAIPVAVPSPRASR